jgi:nucleoside-diphosphate kinase
VSTMTEAEPGADQGAVSRRRWSCRSQPLLGSAERTLVVFKPDTLRRGLVSVLAKRFQVAGLDLLVARRRWIDAEFVFCHHQDLAVKHGDIVVQAVVDYMTSGPVIASIWEGPDAPAIGRALIGPTFPADAPPGTIRGDYADFSVEDVLRTGTMPGNLVHGSRTSDDAKREIRLWFPEL